MNYNSNAKLPGTCVMPVLGCTDTAADNFWAAANQDSGECLYAGCTDSTRPNYDPAANTDSGKCTPDKPGCLDKDAINYWKGYNRDDGTLNTTTLIPAPP